MAPCSSPEKLGVLTMVRTDHSITCRVITIVGGDQKRIPRQPMGIREVGEAMNRAEPTAAHAAKLEPTAAPAAEPEPIPSSGGGPTVETFDPILLSVISSRI